MKILQICHKSPFPPFDGGSIAMNNITQGLLKAGHSVKVFAMSTTKQPVSEEAFPAEYKEATGFESVFVDTDVTIGGAFKNLFSKKSYNVERFNSGNFSEKLMKLLTSEQFDIIQLESIYTTPYITDIRKHSDAKVVLRAHNIEHCIWERLAAGCSNPLKKHYLEFLAAKLKKYENTILHRVDGIAAITYIDAAYFEKIVDRKKIVSIPVGIEKNRIFRGNDEREFPGIFHLGSMDWKPNEEGIKWFLENVWSRLPEQFATIPLYLAGRNMPDWLKNTKVKNVTVLGEINNANQFMQSHTIMIVPLLSGSGIRVKIIEGMACGNMIISTSIGAEGIHYTSGENIFIADTPDEFIYALNNCLQLQEMCKTIGENARKLVATEYDNDVITEKLIEFYHQLIRPLE